jgi:NADPH-dependent 7-cyano-7-deazaguanine reductase QueF-like protein
LNLQDQVAKAEELRRTLQKDLMKAQHELQAKVKGNPNYSE